MGKKREREATSSEHGSPKKKHKKTHHKKHKSKTSEEVEGRGRGEREGLRSSSGSRPLTLKIKLGNKLISSSSTTNARSETPSSFLPDDTSSVAESESIKAISSVGVAEDDWAGSDISVGETDRTPLSTCIPESNDHSDVEEEAWLDALEAGQVDERGYLPRKQDQGSLTARQKAMLGDGAERELLELPIAKASLEMTEEMMLKKTEKNRKRRLQAQKRKERRKAETVRRLLEKQTTKKKEEEKPKLPHEPTYPHIRFTNSSITGTFLSLPPGMEFPLKSQQAKKPLQPQLCAASGCGNIKRYSDSLTHLPLCSLECYRKLRTLHHTKTLAV